MDEKTQFSIRTDTKDELDKLKIKHKEDILKMRTRKKRYVTNDDVIAFLLKTYAGQTGQKAVQKKR